VIAGTERYTAAEVAELAGVQVGFLLAAAARWLQVPGPDERSYIDADIGGGAHRGARPRGGGSRRGDARGDPTLGRGLSRSSRRCVRSRFGSCSNPVRRAHAAQRYADAAADLGPLVSPLVVSLLTVHLHEVPQSEGLPAEDRSAGRLAGSSEVTVCFVDLVASHAWVNCCPR